MESTSNNSSEPTPKAIELPKNNVESESPCPHGNGCPLLDKVLVLLLNREEGLLGDIVEECNNLVSLACDQAEEMAEYLDETG